MDPRYTTTYGSGQGFVNPSLLQLPPQQPTSPRSSEFADNRITPKYIEEHPLKDGAEYVLHKTPRRTPAAIEFIEGTWKQNMEREQRPDRVLIAPRHPDFTGKPSVKSISFSINGNPGPYLVELRERRVLIDGANDTVFNVADRDCSHWKQTNIRVDWPTYSQDIGGTVLKDVKNMTRAVLAFEVACIAYDAFEKFARSKNRKQRPSITQQTIAYSEWLQVPFENVRILGLSYYRTKWVPILAISMT